MHESDDGESIVVVPEKGADDKIIVVQEDVLKVYQLWSFHSKVLIIKQFSCKKVLNVNNCGRTVIIVSEKGAEGE